MKYLYVLITICFLTSSCDTKKQKDVTEKENTTVSTTNPTVSTQEQTEEYSQTETYLENQDEYSYTTEDYEDEGENYEYEEGYEEGIGASVPICDADLSEFISYIQLEIPSKSGYENLYAPFPVILKNDKCNFALDAYPYDIYFKVIPKVSDTLIVSIALDTEIECSSCLKMTSIKSSQKGTLYYHISQNDNIIANNGSIDTVIEEQSLSYSDLEIDNYFHKDYDFMNNEYIQEILEANYIFNSNESWKNNNSITDIHTKVTSSALNISNLDSLKNNYEKFIMPQKEVTLDNLLTSEKDGYFHTGGFSTIKSHQILLETVNIIFISPENEIYTVKWLEDWEELIRADYGPPLDDNYVSVIDGEYKIDKWDNNTEINLFHPEMEFGDYLVIYEGKLKGRDAYIQSPIEVITYKKPKS